MGAPRGAEGRHSRAGRRRGRMVPVPSAPPRLLLLPNALLGRPAIEAEASPALPPSPSPSQPPRKRQRLAHLSPEEKALRRKLKNRVAAQSARDRKKARMGELERQAIELEAQNQRLSEENRLLREEAQGLAAENQELRLRLAGLHPSGAARGGAIVAASIKEEGEGGGASSPAGPAESAALGLSVPLQKGQAQHRGTPDLPRDTPPLLLPWIQLWMIQALSLAFCWACWRAWTRRSSSWNRKEKNRKRKSSCMAALGGGHFVPYGAPLFLLWGPQNAAWRPLMDPPPLPAPTMTTSTPSPSPTRTRTWWRPP
ncbi:X-box-binding protein 1 [Anolis carolinensis]|uniref:X-box-binding protein 1 n=1 Tax=Anolis carolinensis TaxID=28377 RepID=UPI002F2B18A1